MGNTDQFFPVPSRGTRFALANIGLLKKTQDISQCRNNGFL
ncbi:hypothetical protein SAMN04487891_113145 [Flagellimonas taeanensis]|uniref:Uncharacterized protein n=1 Tax=Flagellimonas taeanensis TaxID=1005926 RepID=A0A1I1K690_9FLAO|nr:hypothetical protein SAMN04487891_113145 [Allomuricauda taeanensis]